MVGYLFVLLAVLGNEINGYCGKKTSGYTTSLRDAVLFNSIRMVLCVLIALGISVLTAGLDGLGIRKGDFICILISGIFNPLFLVTWLITVKTGAYLMVSVFIMLGVIVPSLGSQLLFGELIQPTQWIGFGILVAAAVVLCSYNNKIKKKIRVWDLLLLLLCGLSSGINDFSQKIFAFQNSGTPISTFHCYSFLMGAGVLGLCALLLPKDNKSSFTKALPPWVTVYMVAMAVCLFLNAFFQTEGAGHLSSAVVFPMTRGLSLVAASVMAAVCFRERITLKCVIGILMALCGIVIINL